MYKAISTIREFIENNEYDIEFEQEDFLTLSMKI